ncbi:multiple sugar-binding protein [Comamonadaceae bacterium OS-1]|nr:multiple sugar-binding protein [Comamonadaceae bacterium OS-1]
MQSAKMLKLLKMPAAACGLAWATWAAPVHAQATETLTEWDIQVQPVPSRIVADAQARFEKANPQVKVVRSAILNDPYKTKIKIAFGANEPPCVFSSWGGGPLREYVRAGQVTDLSPYLAKDEAFRERFVASSFDTAKTDSKTYGVPAENTSLSVIYYNTELFAKLKLQPPKTWPELLQTVETLKANGVAPFALANKSKWPGSMYFMYLVDRIGGAEVFRKAADRTPGGSFADPVFVEAGKRLQELVKAGAFAQGFNGLDYDIGSSRRLLYSGKAAMTLMGSWEGATIKNENPEFSKKLDFFAFPSLPGGKSANGVVGTVGDNFYSISKACKQPDLAFNLIKAMVDDTSVQARLADNRIVPIKGLKVTEPNQQRLMAMLADSKSVQLWYDQDLPPKLGELHKDLVQSLFALSITPEEAAQKMETAAKAELH